MNRLTVLNVAYPLATVGPDAVGGAEQVLTHIDRALVRAGHHSIVIACQGSQAAGMLVTTPCRERLDTGHFDEDAHRMHRAAIADALGRWPIDVVHLHGIDFSGYLPPPGPPTLVTLHLPPDWYPPEIFFVERPETYLHCVSQTQRAACPPSADLLPVIENGVPVEQLRNQYRKRNYAISIGRICWEKGFHLALVAAARAEMPFLLAGEVFPYPAHREYFATEIKPKLDRERRFIGPVSFRQKRRLLGSARALLVTSLVPETSSLVTMEALACGTPVIAFRNGALTELIDDGRTGFLVDSAEEMAAALRAVDTLDPAACRAAAVARFSVDRMTQKYLDTYEQLASNRYFGSENGTDAQPSHAGTAFFREH
jgi:glycosyltransferase involved in cell wall biosynthesis